MDELLFKGKRKDNDEWVEGPGINTQQDFKGKKHFFIGVAKHSVSNPTSYHIEWYEVYPESVGQYINVFGERRKVMITNADIWAFLGSNNISVSIHQREDADTNHKFYCTFHAGSDTANISDGMFYKGIFGDGATPDEAFTNMCKLCSGKTIEFKDWTDGEYTPIKIQFPIFI